MSVIILSAFNEKLKSGPMDWSSEPYQIRMPVSTALPIGFYLGKDIISTEPTFKTAIFQHTGRYEILPNNNISAAIYELTIYPGF